MKKSFFVICSLAICLFITSCGEDGCSLKGEWKVSEIKVESTNIPESIVKLMENEYKATTYQFQSDGSMSVTSTMGEATPGTYKFDKVGNVLTWKDLAAEQENILQVTNCTKASIELVQRMPSDLTQPESAKVTMTLVH